MLTFNAIHENIDVTVQHSPRGIIFLAWFEALIRRVHVFFAAQLGDGSLFQYWTDN